MVYLKLCRGLGLVWWKARGSKGAGEGMED